MNRPYVGPPRVLPLGPGVTVVAEDANGVMGLAKPEGILSHPNRRGEEGRSLLTAPYDEGEQVFTWTDAAGQVKKFWLLNRLDSATSGVILGAIDAELAEGVRAEFLHKHVEKIYLALVFGAPAKREEIWHNYVAVEKKGARIRTRSRDGNMLAESRARTLRVAEHGNFKISLMQLRPLTGRSHQLRVQCAERHLPIVGDQTYGDFKRNRAFGRATGLKRLFLHSLESEFAYTYRFRRYSFRAQAPMPPEFSEATGPR